MSHDLTLPPIPGLVRRTTPMVDDYGRRGVVSALTAHDWTIALDDIDEQPKRAIGPLPIVGWSVDLTDATGRAHAAWWLALREVPPSHHLDPAAVSWSRAPAQASAGWAMHWCARAVVGSGSLTGTWWTGSDGSPLPRALLADLDPNDDTRLPDGSRRVDAEALRRVVLHIAGVTA